MNFIRFLSIFPLAILISCCFTVAAIELIEDDPTMEEEDMAKALAQSKTYFWRKMVERWHCSEETLNQHLLCYPIFGYSCSKKNLNKRLLSINKAKLDESKIKLKEICEDWKTMAMAADAYVKRWGKCKKNKNESSTMNTLSNDHNLKVKVNPSECLAVKPLFLLKKWRKKNEREYRDLELQMSSAMAAIVLMCREMLLKGSEGNKYFKKTEISFVNKDECAVTQQKPSDYNGSDDLNKLTYVETNEKGDEKRYLDEFKTSLNKLAKQIIKKIEQIEEENQFEIAIAAHAEYEKLWDLVPEIGIDLNEMCKIVRDDDYFDNVADVIEMVEYFYADFYKEMNEYLNKFTVSSDEGQMQLEYGAILGQTFKIYQIMIYEPMEEKKYKKRMETEKDKKEMEHFMTMELRDPCEEAKFRVKLMNTEEDQAEDDDQSNKDNLPEEMKMVEDNQQKDKINESSGL